ncbi:MAG: hypothetical protein RQ757_00340 [Pseudomonadales bacterium]|nr:hypothetical protein [Pseudomonadales bacterium]
MNKQKLKKILLTNLIAGLSGIAWIPTQAALERIGDFALLDDQGEFHQLSRYQHRKAMAIMSYVQDCESMDEMLQDFKALREQFADQNIAFLLLDPMGLSRAELAGLNTGFPVLQDEGQLIAEKLQLDQAGAVRLLNPARLSLYYRGSSKDVQLPATLSSLLTQTITDTVSGSAPASTHNACTIPFPAKQRHTASPPDYARDVAPVIIENCLECHREGGAGPFALDKYVSLLGWSAMIKEVLLNKRMPPAQVDPHLQQSGNARYLPVAQLQTLVHWIDAGAPRGAVAEDPLEQQASDNLQDDLQRKDTWLLGDPDFIVDVPANRIPASGILDYLYVDIDLPFTEDKWVRAVQYKAGAPAVLHHLMTFVTAPGEDFWGDERTGAQVSRRFLESYAPGRTRATEYPPGTAILIPRGHKLSMQFHYVSNGQEMFDQTQLALYFAEPGDSATTGHKLQERLTQAVSAQFTIPANDPDFQVVAEQVFTEDVVITGVRARMNYRGKKMKFSVEQADGSLRDFFSIPAYNYGWQPHYILDEPLVLAAGRRVQISGAFDNSVSNPANPDPDKVVYSGVESEQEMFTGYLSYHRLMD